MQHGCVALWCPQKRRQYSHTAPPHQPRLHHSRRLPSGRPNANTVVEMLRCFWKAARAGMVAPDRTYLGGLPISRSSTCGRGERRTRRGHASQCSGRVYLAPPKACACRNSKAAQPALHRPTQGSPGQPPDLACYPWTAGASRWKSGTLMEWLQLLKRSQASRHKSTDHSSHSGGNCSACLSGAPTCVYGCARKPRARMVTFVAGGRCASTWLRIRASICGRQVAGPAGWGERHGGAGLHVAAASCSQLPSAIALQ